MKRLILLVIMMFFGIGISFGQGSETFTNSNATASYANSNFIGDNSVTWVYVASRDDNAQQITGKGLMLRRLSDNSSVTSSSVPGGIGSFTCKLLKGFTGAGNRQVTLYINGNLAGTSATWDNTNVQTFTVNNINLTGNVMIQIRNNTGNQVIVDDISWTGFANAAPSLVITGTPTNHGSSCAGTPTGAITYTITNTGTAASNVVINNSNTTDFTVSVLSSNSLAATNGTATFTVTFNPATSGGKTAILTSRYNTSTDSGTLAISGTGNAIVAASVTTSVASSITASAVTLNGNVGTLGVCPNTIERGFIYSETSVNNNPQFGGTGTTKTANGTTTAGARSLALSGLSASTNYSFVAYLFNGTTYTYGTVQTFTTAVLINNASDVISAGGTAVTVSSLINDAIVSTNSQGVQVWQFTIRDGGVATDADLQPTIVNSITISQGSGNAINDWSDAIQSVALFNGTTKIAVGIVTANQITFSGGPLISVSDDSSLTLSIRLSMQNSPDNVTPGTNIDGDDFMFQISSGNVIFDSTGSGKSSFAAVSSTNDQNVFSVVASQLVFGIQPSNTVLNGTMMPNPTVRATDINGNTDRDFVSQIAITSSGAMSPTTNNANATLGIATFANVLHTAVGTAHMLNATATGLNGITSIMYNITTSTIFKPGDLLFVGFDAQVLGSGADDELLIATMVDVTSGTTFSILNSRYEAGAAANIRTNKWGGSGDIASVAPAIETITYSGGTIPKGSIIAILIGGSGIYSVKTIIGTTISTNLYNNGFTSTNNGSIPNISSSEPDQIYLMQGSIVFDGTVDANQANYILNGTLLHGFSNQIAWVPLNSACSGSATRQSRLHPTLTCFNVQASSGSNESGYYENDKPHNDFKRTILNSIGTASNWTFGASRYTLDALSNNSNRAGKTFTITSSTNLPGTWIGDRSGDTQNWFNCGNWEGLAVPDANTDVFFGTDSVEKAFIKNNAIFSDNFSHIAQCKNLTISTQEVNLEGNANNKIEINGNLLIDGAGVLDMSDDNDVTADGQIYLIGDWINNTGNESNFKQGNSTVHFNGSSPQIINNVLPVGTEIFYNVVLNNDYNTALSNDLFAQGNLTVSASKTLDIAANDYVEVDRQLINIGEINVANNGSLVQTVDGISNTNTGTFSAKRIATLRLHDYTYWSKPISSAFSTLTLSPNTPTVTMLAWTSHTFTTNGATNGIGNWSSHTSDMFVGRGYAVRAPSGTSTTVAAPFLVDFQGPPNNGIINVSASRGDFDGANYAGVNGTNITKDDDNWNLIGNPYPSALNVVEFLSDNPDLEGDVQIWSHGILPTAGTAQPFYGTFAINYSTDNYIIANGTGSTPPGYDNNIPSGQGFFVRLKHSAASPTDIVFNNSQRKKANLVMDNSQFYRSAVTTANTTFASGRIWLDLVQGSNRKSQTLLGYIGGASDQKDNVFDSRIALKEDVCLYSIIGNEAFSIQGKSNPFIDIDQVPLGLKTISGIYTVAIHKVDGVFDQGGQTIYLEDKLLNVIHNLSINPYVFSAASGVFNDRFVLRFNNISLTTTNLNKSNDVLLYNYDGVLNVKSNVDSISSINVFDVLGRNLFSKNNIDSNTFAINQLSYTSNALFVKIILFNGQSFTKKIVF